MDPFTAILLIGVMTIAGVKTAGDKVNDGIAQARGNTPASLEKWRANEEKRRKRGEQPREDPGGLKRIWANRMDFAGEKSAKKHQGRMEYLHEHGDEIAAGKRARMERGDRRRQAVGGVLASAGGSSWEAMKTAAQKAADARRNHAERKTEKDAWRENERRDEEIAGWVDEDGRGHPRRYSSENGSGWELPVVYGEDGNPYCVHPDGSWSPYEPAPIEAQDAVADGTVVPFDRKRQDTEQDDIVRRWREAINSGEERTNVVSGEEWNSLPTDLRDQLMEEGRQAGFRPVAAHPNGEKSEVNPDGTIDTNHGTGNRGGSSGSRSTGAAPVRPEPSTDPEHDFVRDPDRPGDTVSVAELQRRRREQADARRRQHEAEQAQADREHAERMAAARPDSTDPEQEQHTETETDTEQNATGSNTETAAQTPTEDTMSQPQSSTTEITDLTTAQMRAKESQQYAGKVVTVISDQLASIQAAISGMQSEAQMQESGSGSLAGEGFNSRITGRFDAGAEAFNNAVAELQKQVTAAQSSMQQVETAQAEMKAAAAFFGKQQSLADEVGSAKQDGGVSKRTDFYAESGA